MKKLIYIAHPINGQTQLNIKKVINICSKLHRADILPFAPYITPLQYLDDNKKSDRTKGLKYNSTFFERKLVDELWLYGNKISTGMLEEIKLAYKFKIPIKAKSPSTKKEFTKIKSSLI